MTNARIVLAALAMGGLCLAAIPSATAGPGDEPINATCPISQHPIDGKTTTSHDGHTIGFCCGKCVKAFESWDEQRKVEFVALATTESAPSAPAPTTRRSEEAAEPALYTLAICPVSGQKLGSMGDPVVKVYGGQEVRFCCAGCIGDFEAKQDQYTKKIEAEIIKDQARFYPMDTCVVMGDPLTEDGEDIAVDYVHGNRLFRLCCKGCIKGFNKDPQKYHKMLDEAIVKQQREHYPVEVCLVGGGKLGSMGEPVEVIAGNRLVRFCCAGCVPKFKKDPVAYLTRLDQAWMSSHGEGHEGGHGDAGHGHGDAGQSGHGHGG